MTEPIYRAELAAADLVVQHPPLLYHDNKRLVYELSCPPGAVHAGTLRVSRWPELLLPEELPMEPLVELEVRESPFDYQPAGEPGVVRWYLNFAHSDLFRAYGGPLCAQDELPVAEHPALASLRELMLRSDLSPSTRRPGSCLSAISLVPAAWRWTTCLIRSRAIILHGDLAMEADNTCVSV